MNAGRKFGCSLAMVAGLACGAFALTAETALEDVTLPEGYQLLDHVRTASQGPYVNTDFVPDGTVSWELVMRWDGAKTGASQHVMGSRIAFQNNAVGFSVQTEPGKDGFTWHYGDGVYYSTAYPSYLESQTFNVIAFTPDRKCEVDGVLKSSFEAKTVTTTRALYLFTCNNNGSPHAQKATAAVRRFRIWQGETLVRDYVPAKRLADDAVGLYDLVATSEDKKFVLPVSGSGSLVAGSPVDTDDDSDPILGYGAAGDRGTVVATAGGDAVESGASVSLDAAVELTATPNEGYEFAYWGGVLPDGVSRTDNPAVFAMPALNVGLTAYFVPTNRVIPAGWMEPTNGVLLLTFDDNAVDSWLAATNLFARYGAHASFAVYGDPSNYGANGEKLMVLKACGHTVGLHTQNHVNTDGYEADPGGYFDAQVKPQLDKFEEMGHACSYMAYPNNKHTAAIDAYIRENSSIRHFRAGEVATETESPYYHALAAGKDIAHNDGVFSPVAELAETTVLNGMGCAVQQYGTDIDVVRQGLDRIAANNEVMVLFSHDIQETPTNVGMTPTMLEAILARAQELGVRVVGADELPYIPDEEEDAPPAEPETDVSNGDLIPPAADGFTVYCGLYERLESLNIDNGTAEFDTGYVCKSSTRFRAKIAITELPATTEKRARMGVTCDEFLYACAIGAAYDNGAWKFFTVFKDRNFTNSYGPGYDAEPHEFDLQSGCQSIDGVEIGTSAIDSDFPEVIPEGQRRAGTIPSLGLFRLHNNFENTDGVVGRFYYAEISENGTAIHQYYPVVRLSDNAVGLYDTVSKTFRATAGTVANRLDYTCGLSRSVIQATVRRRRNEAQALDLQLAPATSNTWALLYVGCGEAKGGDTLESWETVKCVGAVPGSVDSVSVPWPDGAKYARWFWASGREARLPASDKYTSEVAYIASAGGSSGGYVDTGICPDETTSYEVDAVWEGTGDQFLLGCRDKTSGPTYSLTASTYGSGVKIAGGYASTLSQQQYDVAPPKLDYQRWSFDATTRTQKLDDTVVNVFATPWPSGETSPYSFYLLTCNNMGTAHANRMAARVKSFKLWKGGDLKCDYVPVRVGDKPGFYDRASGDVKYATGGTFTCGNDIAPASDSPATETYAFKQAGFAVIIR